MSNYLEPGQKVWFWYLRYNKNDVLEVTVLHGTVLQSIESVWGKDAYAIMPDGMENTSPCNVNILRSHIAETKQGVYESLVHGLDELIWDLEKNMDSKVEDLRDQIKKANAKLKQATAAYAHNRDLLEGLRKEAADEQSKAQN
jgi:hypothetical protein